MTVLPPVATGCIVGFSGSRHGGLANVPANGGSTDAKDSAAPLSRSQTNPGEFPGNRGEEDTAMAGGTHACMDQLRPPHDSRATGHGRSRSRVRVVSNQPGGTGPGGCLSGPQL